QHLPQYRSLPFFRVLFHFTSVSRPLVFVKKSHFQATCILTPRVTEQEQDDFDASCRKFYRFLMKSSEDGNSG
ncbi:hypothetical protein, partial [Ferrovum myxofaciens]|uniref:hypothetical protein n=1 Tax=Ferrovum myxofaciens TaxID=416213 RepID=UPI000558557B